MWDVLLLLSTILDNFWTKYIEFLMTEFEKNCQKASATVNTSLQFLIAISQSFLHVFFMQQAQIEVLQRIFP